MWHHPINRSPPIPRARLRCSERTSNACFIPLGGLAAKRKSLASLEQRLERETGDCYLILVVRRTVSFAVVKRGGELADLGDLLDLKCFSIGASCRQLRIP